MQLNARSRIGSARGARGGFTLAEAAVTIAIVAIALSMTLQSLNGSKLTAAHTRNSKLSRDLGLITLGEIGAGEWWDRIESERTGNYADLDHPDFYYELALGDETFLEYDDEYEENERFDNWAYRDEQRALEDDEDEDEESVEPYEKVRIKITFPQLRQFESEIILERWIPWAQVYGEDEEEQEEEAATGPESPDAPSGPDGPNEDG